MPKKLPRGPERNPSGTQLPAQTLPLQRQDVPGSRQAKVLPHRVAGSRVLIDEVDPLEHRAWSSLHRLS